MLPLSCSCSLAREDVSYPNSRGAKAPLGAHRLDNRCMAVLWRIFVEFHTMCALAAHISKSTRTHHPSAGRTLAAPVVLGRSDT